MKKPKILHLTLKERWFNLILSGDKKEEYREIKAHYISRLLKQKIQSKFRDDLAWILAGNDEELEPIKYFKDSGFSFKDFDFARLCLAYAKNRPEIDIEIKNVKIGIGEKKWGAEENELYFVIELGDILETRNILERITPFSNLSEFTRWTDKNCDLCNRYSNISTKKENAKCKLAFDLDLACVTDGTISLDTANKIGFKDGYLQSKCNGFNKPMARKKHTKKIIGQMKLEM